MVTKPLSFLTIDTDLAFVIDPTYNTVVTYGESINAVHTASNLLYTESEANLVRSAHILSRRWNRVKKEALARLRTASNQLPSIGGLIVLHIFIGNLCKRVCFGIAPHFGVNFLLDNVFISSFIRRFIRLEQMGGPWRSQPVSKLVNAKNYLNHQHNSKYAQTFTQFLNNVKRNSLYVWRRN